ncbi:T9SS type A sorting domain-containing protein [Membranihabitans marinus]|uniref:T9SS type A sorting domain-containing protein n=1 Tax=Membranihabitans marinus TaxID=1227546 RepID=UPI001F15EE52|nr:T9SS type A sorting domain-containing protein [Membranihabitans marinus]
MLQCKYRIQFILCFFIILQSQIGQSQNLANFQEEKFIVGEKWQKEIQSTSKPVVFQSPKYGSFEISARNNQTYDLIYDNGGHNQYDTVLLLVDQQILSFALKPKFIVANTEVVYGYTGLNETVDVLDNDRSYSSKEVKYLPFQEGLVVSKAGERVRISNVEKGIQYFVYTACDDLGQCDEAKVAVIGLQPDWTNEKISWFYYNNESMDLPLPGDDFYLFSSNLPGVEITADHQLHLPSNSTAKGRYEVVVKDLQGRQLSFDLTLDNPWNYNTFNQPDRIYIHPGQSLKVDISQNDLLENIQEVLNIGQGIQVRKSGNGEVNVTSLNSFQGITSFDYISCAFGICDTAKVEVYVDAFKPALSTFKFDIDPNADYVLPFDNPNPNFELEIIEQGNKGIASILPGNLIKYSPSENFSDEDKVRFKYSVNTANYQFSSEHEIIFRPSSLSFDANCDKCIWSGDTDLSNVVDFKDIQSIARYIGEVGSQRNGGVLWKPQNNEEWFNQENKNIQYFDADGDGIITKDDVYPVVYHYGLHHGLFSTPIADPSIPVQIQTSKSVLQPGDIVELGIYLGDEDSQLRGVNGISLEVNYDQDLVDGEDVKVLNDHSTWLKSNEPTIEVVTQGLSNNVVAGQYRVSTFDQNGHGLAMKMSIIVEDEIEGFTTIRSAKKELELELKNIVVHTAFGSISLPDQKIVIPFSEDLDSDTDLGQNWNVFPNPTTNEISISGEDLYKIEQLTIYNMQGQVMNSVEVDYRQDLPRMYLDRLVEGMYLLEITADGKKAVKRFSVIH